MMRLFALILVVGLAACGKDEATRSAGNGNDVSADGNNKLDPAVGGNSNVTYTGPEVAYKGRFVQDGSDANSADCAWSGCAVETRFTGSSVSIGLSTTSNANIYFHVSVDGGAPSKLKISAGVGQYTVSSPAPKSAHTVRWTKITEAASGSVTFTAPVPSADGALMATRTPSTRLIEFVGDSITAGYGVLGTSSSCSGTPENQDADLAYPALVGAALGADYMQLGFSGRGMAYNNDCTQTGLVPTLYDYAIPPGTQNATSANWDATQFTPAVIVVNVGTNDFSAALSERQCNTNTAQNNPGFPNQSSYETAYKQFLQSLTQTHPDAFILVVYGPMLSSKTGNNQVAINKAYLEDVLSDLSNEKISLLAVGPQGTTTGCDYHPNAATHAQVAQAIEQAIVALPLGWTL